MLDLSSSHKFQFSPPRGGRPLMLPPLKLFVANFNSRPRFWISTRSVIISIPAPARGATFTYLNSKTLCQFQFPPPRGGRRIAMAVELTANAFQFPPPRGGRLVLVLQLFTIIQFQFPPPRGGRHLCLVLIIPFVYFNSRPRAGGDESQ